MTIESPTPVIAVARDYADLRAALIARRHELGLSQLELDDLSGIQDGYTGKLECGMKHFGDMSLQCILGALGVELVIQHRRAGTKVQHGRP